MNPTPEPLQQLVRADLSPAEAQQLVQPWRAFSFGALQQTLVQGGITIDGNYNVIGHGNLILSGEGAKALVELYRELLERDRALHQLPAPPSDFTGRGAELDELLTASNSGGVLISGLQGMGGIGKTVLALKLAERIKDRYPDAQFFLNLEGANAKPMASRDAMAHVIRAYEPLYQMPEHDAQVSGKYHSVLHNQRALLVLDNAASEEQVAPLLPPAGCALLVTSRQHFVLDGMQAKRLEAMTPPDACALLVRIAPRIGTHADTFAKLCGDLPLALRLVASALKVKVNLKPEAYAERLERTGLQLLDEVEAAFQLSYDLLQPEQQRLWCRLSVMRGTFDDAAAAAVWELAEEEATDKLGDLLAYSLVEWDEDASRYHLHSLARLFANARLSDAARTTAQRRQAVHYAKILEEAEALYHKGHEGVAQGLGLFELEWGNIAAGQQWASAHMEGRKTAAQLAIDYPLMGANMLELRQPAHERIVWLESARRAAQHLKKRGAECPVLNNLGTVYLSLGEWRRAMNYFEQSLMIARDLGDRYGEGQALGNLGNAYDSLGEVRRAIDYYEQSLKIDREFGNRRGEGQMLGNLGSAYYFLGDMREAIDYHKQQLTIAHELGDRQGESQALGNLGLAYNSLGEVHQAIECHEQSLKITRELGDRQSESQVLGNLGAAYQSLGEEKLALDYCMQNLTIAREFGDRYGEGVALGNLGNFYLSQGNMNQALDYYNQRLAIAREIGDRQGESQMLGNFGATYASLGELRQAITYIKQSSTISHDIGNRSGEGKGLWNLSMMLNKLGERTQAIASAEDALTILEQIEAPLATTVRQQLEEWKAPASTNGEEVD